MVSQIQRWSPQFRHALMTVDRARMMTEDREVDTQITCFYIPRNTQNTFTLTPASRNIHTINDLWKYGRATHRGCLCVWYDGVCSGGESRLQRRRRPRGEGPTLAMWLSEKLRSKAREVCAVWLYVCASVCVCMCKERGRGDAFQWVTLLSAVTQTASRPPTCLTSYQLLWRQTSNNPPPLPCQHKYACLYACRHTNTHADTHFWGDNSRLDNCILDSWRLSISAQRDFLCSAAHFLYESPLFCLLYQYINGLVDKRWRRWKRENEGDTVDEVTRTCHLFP